jgi:hypothetical protein
MSISAGSVVHNQNFVPINYIQWPLVLTTSSQDEQEPTPPSLPVIETEQLLDIAGLLEIEKIVHNIRKEERVKSASEEGIGHFKIKQVKLPKINQH